MENDMRHFIKKIFEKDGFAQEFIDAMNDKSNSVSKLYDHLKKLVHAPYFHENDFPDLVLKWGGSKQRILLVDPSVKSQRRYRIIESIWDYPVYNRIIMFFFNHWGIEYKVIKPLFIGGFKSPLSIEGLGNAIKEAKERCWSQRGFVIIQGSSTRYTLFGFDPKYKSEVESNLNGIVPYKIVTEDSE